MLKAISLHNIDLLHFNPRASQTCNLKNQVQCYALSEINPFFMFGFTYSFLLWSSRFLTLRNPCSWQPHAGYVDRHCQLDRPSRLRFDLCPAAGCRGVPGFLPQTALCLLLSPDTHSTLLALSPPPRQRQIQKFGPITNSPGFHTTPAQTA